MRKRTFPGKRRNSVKTSAVFFALCCVFIFCHLLPLSAAPSWKQQGEGTGNAQGDQKQTGKSDGAGEAPVYGAIGSLDDKFSMDIDGDGTADVTIPEADLIEVSVTPSIVVNVYPQKPGGEEVMSNSAEGIIKNENAYNRLKVSLGGLVAQDENAEQITVTDELDKHTENGLSLFIYAEDSGENAFLKEGESLGSQVISLTNTAQEPAVPITLGTLSEKGSSLAAGTYLFQADCRSAFLEKYKDLPITYKAIYKFTIEN